MSEHALYGASGFYGLGLCPGKLPMEQAVESLSNAFADEGTAHHTVAQWVLTERIASITSKATAQDHIGKVLKVQGSPSSPVREFEVDQAMADRVDDYCDAFMIYSAGAALRMVEQRVRFHEFLGVAEGEGFGTADGVAIIPNAPTILDYETKAVLFPKGQTELQIHDLKAGYIRVDAFENEQEMLYAVGTIFEHELTWDIDRVRLVIHMPRKDWVDEWVISVDQLMAWQPRAQAIVREAKEAQEAFNEGGIDQLMAGGLLRPGNKQCKYCDAAAANTCPAIRQEVATIMSGSADASDFDDLTAPALTERVRQSDNAELGAIMAKADMIEGFIKAIRAEAERRLFAGETVPGLKLVEGKKGNRAWADAELAEQALKAMRFRHEEMFKYKLISPTDAEKLLKKDNPRRWASLQDNITQSPGKPSVAPATDARKALAIKAVADDFEGLTEQKALPAPDAHPFR